MRKLTIVALLILSGCDNSAVDYKNEWRKESQMKDLWREMCFISQREINTLIPDAHTSEKFEIIRNMEDDKRRLLDSISYINNH